MAKHLAYVGTYGGDGVHGLPVVEVDSGTGALRLLGIDREVDECTFLAFDRKGTRLYAAAGLKGRPKPNGGLAVFQVAEDGSLRLLDTAPTGANPPCHVQVARDGRAAYCAHYQEGSGMMLPLNPEGTFAPPGVPFAHSGRGPHPTRQEKAHVHCTELSPDGRLLYVVDLGIDAVKAYRAWPEDGRLVPVPEADLRQASGSGPRHIVFRPDGRRAYVVHELGCVVTVWDLEDPCAPRLLQTVPLLPEHHPGPQTAAAIHLSSDHTRLYCSNRGHDSIAAFAVDPDSGTLTHLATSPTLGRWPRDFAVLPGGRMILCAHERTDSLVSLHVDPDTGRLTPTGHHLTLRLRPVRVCLPPE